MTGAIIPTHIDRARALRVVLSFLKEDPPAVLLAVSEIKTTRDGDAFVLAMADMFSMFVRRKVEDPVRFAEGWIAFELQLAEDENPPDSPTPGV